MKKTFIALCASIAMTLTAFTPSSAKVDLVTLPVRDRVQLTIYNSADITLARDIRTLTMKKGPNRLQFAWSGTLIDPTSLEMTPLAQARKINVRSLEFPPRVQALGIWNLDSGMSGDVPCEITYFTSGISWQAYYLATLTPDESAMRLEGYVRVVNNSGEDYENAETRLVVGKINLLDRVAELARRKEPYGRPGPTLLPPMSGMAIDMVSEEAARAQYSAKAELGKARPKEIRKEGLSEYFLYSIEGTEDIANGWGKRLISFTAPEVPVRNLYRYEEERYGTAPIKFISFVNDEKHRLGKEPIPGGTVKVFRDTGSMGLLSYVGAQETRYVPMDEEVNLNLGPSGDVAVKVTPMDFSTDSYEWKDETITGWDEHLTVKVQADNYRNTPVRIEVRRNFPVKVWELENKGAPGLYEKIDADTIQYTLDLAARENRTFTYEVTLHMGSRGNQ